MSDSRTRSSDSPPTTGEALILTERIAAPPETVFEFLTDPEKLLRWMGAEADIDPRPGGVFRLDMNGNDVAAGAYVTVDRPHRVVFTWGWEGSTDVPPGSTTVTVTLTADGDNTLVELRHDGLPGATAESHDEGWGYFLPRLSLAATGREPGPDRHRSS